MSWVRALFLSVITILLLSVTAPAFATGEFQADYDVQYAISPQGVAIVTQHITLTNKQTNFYPQKYSIVLDTTKIKNVIAYDSNQIIPLNISQKDGKTTIELTFNQRVVGLGKTLPFTLRFENGDVAQKNGLIWDINIPGVAPDADIASYNVTLSVPPTFGPNAFMTPLPASGARWTKEQMMKGGISAAYGIQQSYDVTLSYFLTNPTLAKATTELALPPTTAYQTVTITSLEPKPDTVYRDLDGNWLAKYSLLPGANTAVEAKLHIDVTLVPKDGYSDELPNGNIHTKPQKYWESDQAAISQLAKTHTTPRAIYNYVVSTLTYDYSRVDTTPIRKGAVAALSTPANSVCMEFTDLFIAIARAAGIPAREAIGYAYTSNARLRPVSLVTDVLHAWPEYWDSTRNIWVPVDPTWAKTTGGINYFDKLDFSHIVFVYHGTKSDYPFPAGFYRKSGKTTKDVEVQFSVLPFTKPEGRLETTYSFPSSITSGIRSNGTVTIANTTGVEIPSAEVLVQSSPVDVAISKSIRKLPPYGTLSIPLSLNIPNYFTSGTGRLVTSVNGQTSQYSFTIAPITSYFIIPIVSFSAILIILLAMAIHRARLWKHHRKH